MPSLSYHKNVFSFLWSQNEKTIYPLSQSVFHHFHQMFTEQSQSSEHEDESMPCPGLTCDFLRKALLGQPYVLCCCSSVTSHVRLLVAPWTAARQASLSSNNSWSLLKLMSIESVMPSNHLIVPFSSRLQSFPASGSFQMSKFFASGGQSIIYGC